MSDEDSSDKEHEPSQRRLNQAREKGQITRSADLTLAASYGGFVLAIISIGPFMVDRIANLLANILVHSDTLSLSVSRNARAPIGGILGDLGFTLLPLFAIPALAVLLILLAQRSLIFTGDNLMFKMSRISLLSNAKQKFGPTGLFEFAKSAIKLIVVSVVLGVFLAKNLNEIIGTLYLSPGQSMVVLTDLLTRFLFLILAVAVTIGLIDYLWQHFEHLRRNRMSRKEMLDEHKDQEGDPHTKAQRRQRGYDIAMNRMLDEVDKADVIIVNPTHFAVALKWNRAAKQAPVCVAKGVDEIAARIRERAQAAHIPLHSDPPTARALHATIEVGQEIQPEHYRAVAAAIRFAEAMQKKVKNK